MKTHAAILVETARPLELVEMVIPALKPGQVLVEVAYSGVCHTQILEARGRRGEDKFLPHCLGHEGSGVVLEIGPDVTRVKPDDSVVLSWIAASGAQVPGTQYDWNGRKVNAGFVTTFQRHAVVSENRVTPIPADFPKDSAALLGCAIPTGMGAVVNTAALREGQSVAVFGAGGVGLFAIAAAAASGAKPVIAVDILDSKLEAARKMGASHVFNATAGDPVAGIRDICKGGVDIAIECSGRPAVMEQALSSVRAKGGKAVVVGNAAFGERLSLDPQQLNQGKQLLGTWGGDSDPDRDYGRYRSFLEESRIDVRPLMSKPYSLAQVNQAIEDLETGRTGRPLIAMAL
jgi:S-(hydroxymethyl)glutathione dehydrogenase/alcohol dehydrogenase